MDWLWDLLLLAIVLAALWYARRFRSTKGGALYWPWWDSRRGDRAQQAFLVEEEMRRSAESARDRDLAP